MKQFLGQGETTMLQTSQWIIVVWLKQATVLPRCAWSIWPMNRFINIAMTV